MARIGICEDDAAVRRALTEILGTDGHEAVLAHNGHEAIRAFSAPGSVDAIVIDIGPDAEGRDVCQALRAGGQHAPVLFLTALDGDLDESSALVGDDAGAYAVTKRDADAALEAVDGITRVILRPPAILGAGESSVWNSVRPAQVRDDEEARHAVPDQSFAWVHVDDLASLVADVASGRVETSTDPGRGPVAGGCTVVNVAAGPATLRDYYETVTGALGVDPDWDDAPAWTGRILADRAHGWGWSPAVDLSRALAEFDAGLRS